MNSASPLGIPTVKYHVPSGYPASEKSYTTRQRVNNIPTQKETVQPKKQGISIFNRIFQSLTTCYVAVMCLTLI